MSSRHDGNFFKVFQEYLQDQVYNISKYQKIQSKVRGFYQKERIKVQDHIKRLQGLRLFIENHLCKKRFGQDQ